MSTTQQLQRHRAYPRGQQMAATYGTGARSNMRTVQLNGIVGEKHDAYLISYSTSDGPWPPYWVRKDYPVQNAIIAWLYARLNGDATLINADPPEWRLTATIAPRTVEPHTPEQRFLQAIEQGSITVRRGRSVSQVQLTKDQKRAEIKATFAGNFCEDSSSSSSSDGDESDEEIKENYKMEARKDKGWTKGVLTLIASILIMFILLVIVDFIVDMNESLDPVVFHIY
ncbi:uncharacterized protein H6S33_008146 [Morchella sextelata]|uniref:uncharacterized protein n=1 Tax=Morchella sextelata TaxID=1174677 RepID=UPI001D03B9B8|nr:uncharacterized protein H6S33_008146 [Morchella sextelata]KAH0603142.1 hypothetical protein H6S33_008146 [Morchella sextelata]